MDKSVNEHRDVFRIIERNQYIIWVLSYPHDVCNVWAVWTSQKEHSNNSWVEVTFITEGESHMDALNLQINFKSSVSDSSFQVNWV